MSKSTQLLGCVVIAIALAVPDLAWAQAVPRGSGSSSGSSGSSGSGGGSSSGGSGGSGSTSSPPVRTAAPRPATSAGSPSRQPTSSAGTSGPGVSVPPGSRDSSGRPITGGAVPRNSVRGPSFSRPVVWYPWYGYPWYGSGLNWSVGFGSYSPFFYGSSWGLYGAWYNPYASLAYGPYYDPWIYPYGYGGYGAYSIYPPYPPDDGPAEHQDATGAVRVRVKPSNGNVYLDGTFMGVVDQFDGLTDHLAVPVGHHELEIRADGYETLTLPVDVQPDKTVTVRGSLSKR